MKRAALMVRDTRGRYRPATCEQILASARRELDAPFRGRPPMSDPRAVGDYLGLRLADREHEVFVVLLLDARHRLIDCVEVFRGTIDGATVYPREVVKLALTRNAAAVIVGHNHPSGIAEPSESDRGITLKLAKALALVEIRLLDHVVVAGGGYVSLAQRGLVF